jgi:hypothetical protein
MVSRCCVKLDYLSLQGTYNNLEFCYGFNGIISELCRGGIAGNSKSTKFPTSETVRNIYHELFYAQCRWHLV